MSKLTPLLAIAAVALGCLQTQADEPSFIFEEGQPVRARWSDGRQAVMMEETLATEDFSVAMRLNSHTCVKVEKASCRVRNSAFFRKLFLVWESFPKQPARVGHMVELETAGQNREPYGFHSLVTQDTLLTYQLLGLKTDLGPPVEIKLECDRFDWLPVHAETFTAPAWITMFETPVPDFYSPGVEDNSALNQDTAAFKHMLWQKQADHFVLVNAESFTTTVLGHGTVLRGYVTTFSFDRTQFDGHPAKVGAAEEYPSPYCEAEFTFNFSEYYEQQNAKKGMPVSLDFDRTRARPLLYNRLDPQLYGDTWFFKRKGEAK